MPLPHWTEQPDVWDTLSLAGIAVPGVATVDVSRGLEIDKKKAKGTRKMVFTIQGVKSAEINIHIEVNTPDEWTALQQLIAVIEPKAGTGKNEGIPVDIAHPVTAARGIRSILIEDVIGPTKTPDGKSFCSLKIKGSEFDAPPKPTTGTGKGGANPASYPYAGTFTDPSNNLFYEVAKFDPAFVNTTALAGSNGFANFISSHGKKFYAKFIIGVPSKGDPTVAASNTTGDATKTPDASTGGDSGDAIQKGVPAPPVPVDPAAGSTGP